MRRFMLLAISTLSISITALAGDRFEVLSNDDLIRSGLKLELDYAKDVSDNILAFELTAERGGERFTIPCRLLGSFVDNSHHRDGYQRAHCQEVKYRSQAEDQYEILTIIVDKIWSKPTENGRKSNAYKVYVDLIREYANRGSSIRKFKKEADIIFGRNFDGNTIEGAKTRLKSNTGRNIASSPIRLLTHIEQALTPLAQKGSLMYSAEAERSVRAWGFTYHIGEDFTASLSGRWGTDGRAEAGIREDLDLLDDESSIATKGNLTDRSAEILRGTLE